MPAKKKLTPNISLKEKEKDVFVKIQKKIQSTKGKCSLTEKIKYLSFVLQQADSNPFEISDYDLEFMLKNQGMVAKLLKTNKTAGDQVPAPSSKSKLLKEISEKVDAKIHDLSSSSSKILDTIEEKVQEAMKKINK
ncbi:MAG: hypothetical protein HQM13_23305 [SAR324 cluster bacterium]|nr:hypothetical protein [SAR324 cluster bacterium]